MRSWHSPFSPRLSGAAFSQAPFAAITAQQSLGPEDPSKVINVTVWLKQRNKAELDELVRQMYEPGSPNYHHWITRDEYRSRYAPTKESAKLGCPQTRITNSFWR